MMEHVKDLIVLFAYVFFFNETATTEIYPLSLHDALPICRRAPSCGVSATRRAARQLPSPVVHRPGRRVAARPYRTPRDVRGPPKERQSNAAKFLAPRHDDGRKHRNNRAQCPIVALLPKLHAFQGFLLTLPPQAAMAHITVMELWPILPVLVMVRRWLLTGG